MLIMDEFSFIHRKVYTLIQKYQCIYLELMILLHWIADFDDFLLKKSLISCRTNIKGPNWNNKEAIHHTKIFLNQSTLQYFAPIRVVAQFQSNACHKNYMTNLLHEDPVQGINLGRLSCPITVGELLLTGDEVWALHILAMLYFVEPSSYGGESLSIGND